MNFKNITKNPMFHMILVSLFFGFLALIITPAMPQKKEALSILFENIVKSMIFGAFLVWFYKNIKRIITKS